MSKDTPKYSRVGGYFSKNTMHCPEQTAKDNMPNTYPEDLQEPVSDFLQSLFDSGNAFEEKIFSLAAGPGVVELIEQLGPDGERTIEGRNALEQDTFNAVIDPTVKVILGARFGPVFEAALSAHRADGKQEYDPGRISQPDVTLVRRDKDGAFTALVPVDVKDHKVLSKGKKLKDVQVSALDSLDQPAVEQRAGSHKLDDTMQLAHYYRHFEAMGVATANPHGAIIGREEVAIWCELDTPSSRNGMTPLDYYDTWLAKGRAVVANAQQRDSDPSVEAITKPQLSTHCDECHWRTVCDEELVAHPGGGHITLLPGITPLKAEAHYDADVHSIRALAALDYNEAVKFDKDETVTDPDIAAYATTGVSDLPTAILQARSQVSGRVARKVGVDRVHLGRADVEFDFDLENSNGPVLKDDDGSHPGSLVYLWGTRQVTYRTKRDGTQTTTVKVKQFSDFTDTAEGEAEIFAAFWSYMMDSRESALSKGKTWRAFHYTSHEITWMRKLATRHAGKKGVPTLAEIDEFAASEYVVDLYVLLTRQLVWPTRSHSIKSLAKWARFSWRSSDAGGDNSLLWYETAVDGTTGKERSAHRKKVLNYNVDDVAAQEHLREWVSSLDNEETPKNRIPLATSLRRPRVK